MFLLRYTAHIQKISDFKAFITMPWIPKFSYMELMGVCLKQGVQPWGDRLLYNPSPKNPASCFLFSFSSEQKINGTEEVAS